jgi:hypothetical protein
MRMALISNDRPKARTRRSIAPTVARGAAP